MTTRKTHQTDASVDSFIGSIGDQLKQEDCRAFTDLMSHATGQEPKMWGKRIIGFGKRHYQYANGKPAELCKVGFAPRSKSFAFYIGQFPGKQALIDKLGKYQYHGGCLHLKKFADADAKVLAKIIQEAYLTKD